MYWLHTTIPGGGPHVSVLWGLVRAEALYLYSQQKSVKARNLRLDHRVAVHLESGADVLIVYGELADLGRPENAAEVVRAFATKYDRPEEQEFLPGRNPVFDVLYRLEPERALAWNLPDTEASMRRWVATTAAKPRHAR